MPPGGGALWPCGARPAAPRPPPRARAHRPTGRSRGRERDHAGAGWGPLQPLRPHRKRPRTAARRAPPAWRPALGPRSVPPPRAPPAARPGRAPAAPASRTRAEADDGSGCGPIHGKAAHPRSCPSASATRRPALRGRARGPRAKRPCLAVAATLCAPSWSGPAARPPGGGAGRRCGQTGPPERQAGSARRLGVSPLGAALGDAWGSAPRPPPSRRLTGPPTRRGLALHGPSLRHL